MSTESVSSKLSTTMDKTKEMPEDTRDKIIYPYTAGMSYKTIRKMFGEKVTTVAAISSLASLQTSIQ